MAIDTIGANALASNSVTTAKIANDAVTGAKIPADAVVAADIADGSITTAKLADNSVTSAKSLNLGRRNLVINGAMQIWQRGTSIDTISNNDYLCDRWKIQHGGTDGNVDIDRTTDVPDGKGFAFSQKVSMDASESSLDAGDSIRVVQRMEGQNLQSLKKGTSSAESITISFYVKSSVAATYTVNIRDEDNDRDNAKTYTINSANTWEFKSITFAGDTTGALGNDNGRSFDLNFWIDAGTNFTSGTFYNGTWAAGDNTRKVHSTTGWLQSSTPTWFITGVQMETGTTATDFEHLSFAEELALCQRYFCQSYNYGVYAGANSSTTPLRKLANGYNYDSIAQFQFPVEMRAGPTIKLYNPFNGTVNSFRGDSGNYAGAGAHAAGTRGVGIYRNASVIATVFTSIHATADAEL